MSLESAIAYFRSEQEALFRSTVTIKHRSGDAFDANTGAVTPSYTVRASEVPALIRPRSAADVQVGEEALSAARHEGKLPADTDIYPDDIVEVTASTYDADLVGKSFVVKERLNDDWQISRRVLLEVLE